VKTPAARLTRHDYYDAAMRLLAATSADALTINALCEELHVSKGSFYHHFSGWQGFVEYLLETWEEELEIKRVVELLESPGRRVRVLTSLVGLTPHDAEAALRVWSFSNPAVKAAVERVDQVRVGIATDVLSRRGIPQAQAVQIAELYVGIPIHVQMASRPVDVRRIAKLMRSLMDLTVAQYGPQVFAD
jgi:AcrR family transcriptional regulator